MKINENSNYTPSCWKSWMQLDICDTTLRLSILEPSPQQTWRQTPSELETQTLKAKRHFIGKT